MFVGELKVVLADADEFPQSKTAEAIQYRLTKFLDELKIQKKAATMTIDGEVALVKAVKDSGLEYIPCAAHLIHNTVKSTVDKVALLYIAFKKLRTTVKWFCASLKAHKALLSSEKAPKDSKPLVSFSPTRWLHIINVLDRALPLQEAIENFPFGGFKKRKVCSSFTCFF